LIEVASLSHSYGATRALDDVSFVVAPGELFGLLGPNGGGKTTLFRALATMLVPGTGTARVGGRDAEREPDAVRRLLGVVFQSPSLDGKLTVEENLRHQGRLHGMHGATLRARIAEMLDRVGVADRARERVEKLSGGLRRRVDLAKGMLHAPEVLLLDEPTTGLDPGARREVWDYLGELRAREGVTILLTTHLMEEAERCDRIGILDAGRLVALDTPDALKASIGGDVFVLETKDAQALARGIGERFSVQASVVEGRVRFERAEGAAFLPRLVEAFPEQIDSVTLGKPTLEDVFVARTGHRFRSRNP